MSLNKIPAASMLLLAASSIGAAAQYSTPVGTGAAKPKTLRATAVLEWTGELKKPNASRLMPIAIWDGDRYQPAGLYLASPAPLAFEAGTQYLLERAGDPVGLFEVRTPAQLFGQWIGMGKFQAVAAPPPPKPLKPSKVPPQASGAKSSKQGETATESDRPVLHRKSDTGADSGTAASSAPAAKPDSKAGAGPDANPNPDRPTLHKRGEDQKGTDTPNPSGSAASASKAPDVDPDRPTLHRPAGDSSSSSPDNDPDRPTLHRAKEAAAASAPTAIDPDRPRLRHGRPEEGDNALLPAKLEGTPPKMQQIAAVSDAAATPDRDTFGYKWPSPDDEGKMQTQLAQLAQKAVAIANAQAARAASRPGASFGPQASHPRGARKLPAAKTTEVADAGLVGEQFSAFELSFSAGPTLVYSAHSEADPAHQVYVTLVAQPDFNGHPEVLFQQVSRGDRLDEKPAMRLVDAVDTDGDQKAELVFELTGGLAAAAAQEPADAVITASGRGPEREFAIYRVAGRRVSQVFTTGPLP